MGKTPKRRNPYLSSTITPQKKNNTPWRKSARVTPARSFQRNGGHRGLAVAIIVSVLFAGLVACAIIFLPGLFSEINSSNEQIRVALSESRVLSDFRKREIPAPVVTGYHYVDTSNLIGPRFDSATIGETSGSVEADDVTRTATSDAVWRNGDVTVYQELEMTYDYDVSAETWKEAGFRTVGIVVKPNREPNAGQITNDLFPLLEQKDPALAEALAGATIKTESDLNVDGGTIIETLSKQDGGNVNSATVTITVTWSDTEGWVPTISDVRTSTDAVAPSVSGAPNPAQPTSPDDEGANAEVPQL